MAVEVRVAVLMEMDLAEEAREAAMVAVGMAAATVAAARVMAARAAAARAARAAAAF